MISGDCNFPLVLDDFYGNGHLFVLNIPDNFSDLYHLPKDIIGSIHKMMAKNHPVYLEAEAKYNLFLKGEEYCGIRDLESGEEFYPCGEKIRPVKRFDSAKTEEEPVEHIIRVPFMNGFFRFYELIKK